MDKIIPLFGIASLYNECCPGINSRYLAVDPSLVNCDLLDISGILSTEETHQQALGLPTEVPRVTAKRTPDVTAPPPPTKRNQTLPGPPTGTHPPID